MASISYRRRMPWTSRRSATSRSASPSTVCEKREREMIMFGMRILGVAVCVLGASAAMAAEPPHDLDDYVVLGIHRVELGPGSFIAAGNVGVNNAGGTLRLEREV